MFRVGRVHSDLFRGPMPVRFDAPPSLMHWTYPLPLRAVGVPELLTVHDLIPIERPDLSGVGAGRLDRLLRHRLARVDRVVTVSETVRSALIDRYGLAPDRVVNTLQPVLLADDPPDASRPGCLRDGCFVAVGSIEKRKNVARLIRAHGRARVRRPLLLIGPDGDDARIQMSALRDHPAPELVRRLPWVPRSELVGLMRRARAVLFPSLAEGFGLPIAEGMTLGVPVLTSRGGATEEIAGGAAMLVDPTDEAELAEAIAELDRDESRCRALAERGTRRARVFAPEAYAARIDALYRDVLRGTASLPARDRIA